MAGLKERIATLLRENRGTFLSGEEIAERFGVSRAAVWKAVKSLKSSGFEVKSVTNKGYCFMGCDDIITAVGIKSYLAPELKENFKISVVDIAKSTNDTVKKIASEGEDEYYLLVSGAQTNGKGRMGRTFYSPEDTGVYFSLLLRPEISPADAVLITTAAAVCVCEALEKLGVEKPQIKWVNDIFSDGKKICGILTEASFNTENGTLDYAVLGVGLNMYLPKGGFPDEIRDIAGAVFSEKNEDLRNKFIGYFMNSFAGYYKNLESRLHCTEYSRRCFVTGKKIYVVKNDCKTPAKALGVDENCGLLVEFENGVREVLNSGEISIRCE